jgi:predicted ATP-grasp superfamily ATP-dependent carboligase
LYLKINASSIKYFAGIDFPLEIDYESPKNKVQLMDESLEIFLVKKVPGHWEKVQVPTIEFTRAEATQRREEAVARYYKRQEEKLKEAKSKSYEHDKMIINKQMELERLAKAQIKKV